MQTTREAASTIITDSDDFLARLIAPGAMFLVALSIWIIVRMIWKEVDDRRIWILATSIGSLVIFLVIPNVMKAPTVSSVVKGIAALLLFLPYLLGCYLVIVEGLWRLRLLTGGFSFGLVIAAIIYVVGGYAVVRATYNISKFGRSMAAGAI